ncbi:hypothetical protein GSI_00739 [Ganoderma sinense ZZ0214-1]|uniref:Uncharacterized protein n=1 Tax=Ganoderma sinense ZZ0214-1 TaxID=1077348 RepID=A0A2G8STE3_9APHY|nr:hypothetical protein GSI_00739 [Ganoderma sinense ZZ0214-1]
MAAPGPWRESYPSYPRDVSHPPPEPGRQYPFAAGQRQSYFAPGMQPPVVPGFYNPALPHPQTQPPSPPGPPGSPPAFPQPRVGLPPSLVPGRKSTYAVPRSHSNDFFFQSEGLSSTYGYPHLHPRHAQTNPVPAPPLPRKPVFEQPPLPPKPRMPGPPPPLPLGSPGSPSHVPYNGSPHSASYFTSPEPIPGPSAPPLPVSPEPEEDDDAILSRVLEMSAKEARPIQPSSEPMLSEDEQIARALAESLKINASLPVLSPPADHRAFINTSPEQAPVPLPGPSASRPISGSSVQPLQAFSKGSSERASVGSYIAEQISADEALARQLQEEMEEEERRQAEEEQPTPLPHHTPPTQPTLQSQPSLPTQDIQQSEWNDTKHPSQQKRYSLHDVQPSPPHTPLIPPDVVEPPSPEAGPPQYEEVISLPPPAPGAFYNSSLTAHFPSTSSSNEGESSRPGSSSGSSLYRSASDKPVSPKGSSPDHGRPLQRSQSHGQSPSPTSLAVPPVPPIPSPSTSQTSGSQIARPLSVATSTAGSIEESAPATPTSVNSSAVDSTVTNTQYLDDELLLGLSLGFGTPAIISSLKPFESVIPNVIALPYGRCPPFHIKAPSWRNLLKLMARLGGTRLEPTMEALAVVKTEMKLRIVVSFVKVHHASTDWHTVLYMTIDHPVPANAPSAFKYRSHDTNTLPFSYTLSQLPAFLRDGSDAALSKFYTIPVSSEAPLPALPISFPNLATYLASALEHSRSAMHDSSSGVRRLAKLIDHFYPNDRVALDDAPERMGMRRRLKNLVGMGRPQRDRNAEMYELVTPFVPDEHGH